MRTGKELRQKIRLIIEREFVPLPGPDETSAIIQFDLPLHKAIENPPLFD